MRKINKEALDYYIYYWGVDKALDYFKLTDKQAENILFNKPLNKQPERKRKPKESFFVGEVEIVWKIIEDNYKELRKIFITTNDKTKIDITGQNIEDKFHNALIKIVEDLSRFTYIDEQSTLNFIKSALFYARKGQKRDLYRLMNKISFLPEPETVLNNLENDNTDNTDNTDSITYNI